MSAERVGVTEAHVVNEDRFAPIPEALLYDTAICADAVRVYGVLRRHGDNPLNCYPSQRRIAMLIGRSQRSINGWLRQLEERGWIERVPRPSEIGDQDTNGYRVFLVPRVGERGVRAGEREGVRAEQRGGFALDSAPKESQENESKEEREDARAEVSDERVDWQVPDVVARAGCLEAALELCAHWAERLEARGVRVGARARSKAWVSPMEAMLRIDGRAPAQVRRVIDWLEDGRDDVANFWRANVLSPDKLRTRWDQMDQQYQRERNRPGRDPQGLSSLVAEIQRREAAGE